MKVYFTLFILFGFWISGCTAVTQTIGASVNLGATVTSGTATYHCSYFDDSNYTYYDDLSACQNSTLANCSVVTEVFPSGGTANCYRGVDGWQACATAGANWIYTGWSSWCDTGTTTGGNKIYQQNRSVLACSSSVCLCNETETIAQTCTATVDCKSSDPSFVVGVHTSLYPVAAPTPINCP